MEETYTLELTLSDLILLHDSLNVAVDELLNRSHSRIHSDEMKAVYHNQAVVTSEIADRVWALV